MSLAKVIEDPCDIRNDCKSLRKEEPKQIWSWGKGQFKLDYSQISVDELLESLLFFPPFSVMMTFIFKYNQDHWFQFDFSFYRIFPTSHHF